MPTETADVAIVRVRENFDFESQEMQEVQLEGVELSIGDSPYLSPQTIIEVNVVMELSRNDHRSDHETVDIAGV